MTERIGGDFVDPPSGADMMVPDDPRRENQKKEEKRDPRPQDPLFRRSRDKERYKDARQDPNDIELTDVR